MAKTTKKLGTLKAKDLEIGRTYSVKYSTFGRKTGSRGAFISTAFIIQTGETDDECVWVNCPSENESYKAIGIMTSAISNGNKLSIKSLTPVKNGNFVSFTYEVEEYITETELDGFEKIG